MFKKGKYGNPYLIIVPPVYSILDDNHRTRKEISKRLLG